MAVKSIIKGSALHQSDIDYVKTVAKEELGGSSFSFALRFIIRDRETQKQNEELFILGPQHGRTIRSEEEGKN